MDFSYITIGVAFPAIISIPESQSGDTVTYKIYLASDNSISASGNMTFVAGINWKVIFTPTDTDVYILEVTDSTLDIIYTSSYQGAGQGDTPIISPTGNDLTTLAAFKTNFNVKTSSHDTLISNTITQISEYIQSHASINQYFKAANYTEYYDGDGDNILILRKLPVNSITSIYDDTDRVFDDSDDQISSDDYAIDAESGIVQFSSDFPSDGIKNIRAIYNAGFATIPPDIQTACEKLVMADFIEKTTGVNTGIGDDQIYKPDKLRKDAWRILEAYFKK